MNSSVSDFEQYRPQLLGHCYRMLGSVFDADDAVQETMIRAWKGIAQFDGRSSLKTWLYRIATNVCLDELNGRKRRARPIEEGDPSSGSPPIESLVQKANEYWMEPILDTQILSRDASPAERALMRQSVRLAFMAALQDLQPKQRAALLLTEVLELSAAEAAETLKTTVASVNSALQRARAALERRKPREAVELSAAQQRMLQRYVSAFESYDVEGLTSLMRQDVEFCMPPYSLWLQGPAAVKTWMTGLGSGCEGSRLTATSANGWPAFAQYRVSPEGGHKAWALIVLELEGSEIVGVNNFLDVDRLFPRFGLPLFLPPS